MTPAQNYMPIGEFTKRVLLLAGLIVAGLTLWQLRLVLLLTFLAIIIAVSLDIPVRSLQSRGFKRSLAIIFVGSGTIAGIGLLGFFIGSPLVEQTQNLFEELPNALSELNSDYNTFAAETSIFPKIDLESSASDTNDTSSLLNSDTLTGGAVLITSVGSLLASVVVNLVLVVIVSLYLLAEPETYANSFLALIPHDRQQFMLKLMVDLRHALVGWLVTQLFSMSIIGFMIWFSLGVLWGIPNAIALGMLAGLLTFIPNFGSIMAAIPGIIFTLAERPGYVIPVMLTYFVVQQVEANFITPMFMKRRLNIPAAALLVFQVMASVLFGFMGLLLAVPLFMVIVVLIRDLYVEQVLDNINTAIEARKSDSGMVLRVTSSHHQTEEVPLREIFDNDGPLDLSLKEVMRGISRRDKTPTEEQIMEPIKIESSDGSPVEENETTEKNEENSSYSPSSTGAGSTTTPSRS